MGSPYGGAWYGAICKQAPLRRCVAYIYNLNCPDVVTWFDVYDNAKEAKQALDCKALNFDSNCIKISRSAATRMPRAVVQSLRSREGGVWYPDSEYSEYIFWQGGADERNTQGLYPPDDIFMQAGSYDLHTMSAPGAPSGSTFLQFPPSGRRGEHHGAVNSYMQQADDSTHSTYYPEFWPA